MRKIKTSIVELYSRVRTNRPAERPQRIALNYLLTGDEHETSRFRGRCFLTFGPTSYVCLRPIYRQLTAIYGEAQMLETLAILLIILWLVGLISAYTLGGFIHILLVIAIIVILVRIIQGRSVL